MKLLYIWIQQFRHIQQQGIIVDNEYDIHVVPEANDSPIFLNDKNNRVRFHGAPRKSYRKVYNCKFAFSKSNHYSGVSSEGIRSMASLVGENATGKSSIIECLHMRADQFNYKNEESRYFLLVFLDEQQQALVIRTRDIWLSNIEYRKTDYRRKRGFEEYCIPLNPDGICSKSQDITHMISFYEDRGANKSYIHPVMAIPTIQVNLNNLGTRKSFAGMFDYFCSFPDYGGAANKFVVYLRDEASREETAYFESESATAAEYKSYFLYKACSLLFDEVRTFLYREEPRFVASGEQIKRPEHDQLLKEYMESGELLSFSNIRDWPCHLSAYSYIGNTINKNMMPIDRQKIAQAFEFFRSSTYVYNVKLVYDQYLDDLEQLIGLLLNLPEEYFTAFFKIELPFECEHQELIATLKKCISTHFNDRGLSKSLIVDFEWLSAGEYQQAILFSGIFERLFHRDDEFKGRALIFLFDEPEMHMHPQLGRNFVQNLNKAFVTLKNMGLAENCQILMATHSPFIIQEAAKFNSSISLVERHAGGIIVNNFDDMNALKLPNRTDYSFNLVMYKIFGIPTVELHNELFGVLQEVNNCYTNNTIENWFTIQKIQKNKRWISEKNGIPQESKEVTLQTFIRNAIHHPENRRNDTYTQNELALSIDKMIELLSLFDAEN